jgi:hypothetical protein
MPSPALTAWSTSSAAALSQLQAAHRAVGGTRAGRRTNTLQLNYAYVLLLSAHFQAYCRALHSAVTLAACNTWRGALNGLAESFDRVLADHLQTLLGAHPW